MSTKLSDEMTLNKIAHAIALGGEALEAGLAALTEDDLRKMTMIATAVAVRARTDGDDSTLRVAFWFIRSCYGMLKVQTCECPTCAEIRGDRGMPSPGEIPPERWQQAIADLAIALCPEGWAVRVTMTKED